LGGDDEVDYANATLKELKQIVTDIEVMTRRDGVERPSGPKHTTHLLDRVTWAECIELSKLSIASHRDSNDPEAAFRGIATAIQTPSTFQDAVASGQRIIVSRTPAGQLAGYALLTPPEQTAEMLGAPKLVAFKDLGRVAYAGNLRISEGQPASVRSELMEMTKLLAAGSVDHLLFKINVQNERNLRVQGGSGGLYPLPGELESYRSADGTEGKFAWFYMPVSAAAIAAQSRLNTRTVGLAVAEAISDRYLGSLFPAEWTTERDLATQLQAQQRYLSGIDSENLSASERARHNRRLSGVERRVEELLDRWSKLWSNSEQLWESISSGDSTVAPIKGTLAA
jgi:hypothetical protein